MPAAQCPFCEISERSGADSREVYRDEHVVAFFPTEPAAPGHTLVVPRKHVPDIWSLDAATAAQLAKAVLGVAVAIKRALDPQGLNIIQSNGQAATQTVDHLHVHLVPRWEGDGMGRIWPPETHYSEVRKDRAESRLREECRSMNSER